MKKLHGYLWMDSDDSETGWAIVAHTCKEAKKIGWNYNASEVGNDGEWTEVSCRWIKDAKIEGLDVGVITDYKQGLKSGIYGYVEGEKCEVCGEEDILRLVNGKCVCSNCEDKGDEHD